MTHYCTSIYLDVSFKNVYKGTLNQHRLTIVLIDVNIDNYGKTNKGDKTNDDDDDASAKVGKVSARRCCYSGSCSTSTN